ncbi:MAG: (S)-ureidoglycine aminohydrolase, partial [Pseudomonadota bacterium]
MPPAPGGLPGQRALMDGRAVFTTAYAVIPHGVMTDIVASRLPGWHDTRAWILARPMTGFAETFAQLMVEIAPGGGAERPEPDPGAEGALFVTAGMPELRIEGVVHPLAPGSFAWLPPGC